MTRDDYERIRHALEDATARLFAQYDVALAAPQSNVPVGSPEIAAVIGFSSRGFRGTVTFGTSIETAMSCSCVAGVDGVDARDWVGELANQLLGRFKNALLDYGVVLNMATPIAITGSELRFHAHDCDESWTVSFQHDGGEVWSRIQAHIGPSFELTKVEQEERPSAVEGELVLF